MDDDDYLPALFADADPLPADARPIGPDSNIAETKSAALESASQAFVAGYVDNCGFIALFGLFTAHVTGNLALIGAALVDYHGGLVAKLMALPIFVLAV